MYNCDLLFKVDNSFSIISGLFGQVSLLPITLALRPDLPIIYNNTQTTFFLKT